MDLTCDSIIVIPPVTDTLVAEDIPESEFGILLTPPPVYEPKERQNLDPGISFITLSLFLLFCIIGYRYHNNSKFLSSLFRNLMEVKERGNMFDETVRETSFLIFLNMMWCACTGVMLYGLLRVVNGIAGGYLEPLSGFSPSLCMAICIGVAAAYTLFMTSAYILTGTVFSDSLHARIWLKGFAASQGIQSFIFFPLALMFIAYPIFSEELLWVAAITFILAKSLFVWKGLRIFFTQISSWVLFLYYLCSLEIVPLILTYFTASRLCGL